MNDLQKTYEILSRNLNGLKANGYEIAIVDQLDREIVHIALSWSTDMERSTGILGNIANKIYNVRISDTGVGLSKIVVNALGSVSKFIPNENAVLSAAIIKTALEAMGFDAELKGSQLTSIEVNDTHIDEQAVYDAFTELSVSNTPFSSKDIYGYLRGLV